MMLGRELLLAEAGYSGEKYFARGCIIQRHSSNHGSQVEYYWPNGSRRKMLVADAVFRGLNMQAQTALTPVEIPSFSPFSPEIYTSSLSCTSALPSDLTNEYLVKRFKTFETDLSARQLCDLWIGVSGSKNSAVTHCRSKTILGKALDLPNIFQLLIIFILADELDKLDPTANKYPNLKIGRTGPTGRFSFGSSKKYDGSKVQMQAAWSSSAYHGGGFNYDVCYDGRVYQGTGYPEYYHAALPILELAP